MEVATPVPDGFTLLVSNNPCWDNFGHIYADRARQLMGFRVAPHHCNGVQSLHGGALATFADMQLLALAEYTGDRAQHVPTISLTIDYIGPAMVGDWVEAKITVDRVTRRLLFVRALITTGDQTIARSNALYRNNDNTGYKLT